MIHFLIFKIPVFLFFLVVAEVEEGFFESSFGSMFVLIEFLNRIFLYIHTCTHTRTHTHTQTHTTHTHTQTHTRTHTHTNTHKFYELIVGPFPYVPPARYALPVTDRVPVHNKSLNKNMARASGGAKKYALTKLGAQTEKIQIVMSS